MFRVKTKTLVVGAAATALLGSAIAVPASASSLREVSGSLLTEDGVPYAGMSWMVKAVDGSWTDRGTIGSDGSFAYWTPVGLDVRFWVGAGHELDDPAYGSIFCTGADYFGDDGTAITVPSDLSRLDIRTPAARYMTVRVTDVDGEPVTNATVLADSWAARYDRLDLGPNYRACMGDSNPQASLDGYPGVNYVAGWLPGYVGGTTDESGTTVIATPAELTSGNVAVVKLKIRPGAGEQTLSVPASALEGEDPYRQTATVVLPEAPIVSVPEGEAAPGEGSVEVETATGEPVVGAQLDLVPVATGMTALSTSAAAPVTTATTDARGIATFTGVTQTGLYRATPKNVSARSVDLQITGKPVAVTPPVVTQPTLVAKVKAVSGRSKLKVDVNPNRGPGYYTFKVQYLDKAGNWKTKKGTYRTKGAKETRTINLRKGTYRVVVKGKYGYRGTTSAPVYLKR